MGMNRGDSIGVARTAGLVCELASREIRISGLTSIGGRGTALAARSEGVAAALRNQDLFPSGSRDVTRRGEIRIS
jgi:hypothetical protein